MPPQEKIIENLKRKKEPENNIKQENDTKQDVLPVISIPTIVEKQERQQSEEKALIYPQVLSALAGSLGFFVSGTVNGWSGSALTQLDSDFVMGSTELSLVVSAISFGALLGSLLSGKTMDMFGRRKTVLFIAPVGACGWAIIGSAPHIYLVYSGRFLCGFATGFYITACQIYTSETCQASLRGRLGSLPTLCLSIGILASYTIGGLLPWRISCYIFIIPCVALFVIMYVVPESPYWFLLKGKNEEARQSLSRLRGLNYIIDTEIKEMEAKLSSVGTNVSYMELFKPRTRLPLLIALFIQTLQQICGGNVIMMYTSKLMEEADLSVNIQLATVYTGVAQVLGTIMSFCFIDWLGRRSLLAFSVAGTGAFTFVLGGYYYVLNTDEQWPTWSPLIMFLGVAFTYCIGCRTIPWLISSEVFNTSVRSKANSVCVLYNRILNIVVVQVYPYIRDASGNSTVMFMYGTLSLLCAIGTCLFVPETKGKTLEDIQEYFEEKAFKQKEIKQGKRRNIA